MNALFVTTNWPSDDAPVNGTFVREHALAVATFADVRVVHLQRAPGTSLLGLEEVGGDPPVIRARYRRYGRPVSAAAFLAAPLAAQRRLSRRTWRPDVIHAHSYLSALPALALGRVLRRPVVYTEHWAVFLPESSATLSRPMRVAARFALRHADLVLPVSAALAAALHTVAPQARQRVIRNVVDPELFYPSDRAPSQGPVRLLTVGLMHNDAKGIDVLLEALAHLSCDVHLDVIGDGALRASYEQLARDVGVDDLVTFRGLLPKADVAAAMRRADLFVLASRYENNPCVLLEAMASGLPVVATRVGGVPEIAHPPAALLAAPNDVGSLVARLREAIEHRDRFDREATARDAVERYGRAEVARQLADAYASVRGITVEELQR